MTATQFATTPRYDQLPLRDGVRCSWGLWGSEDRLGTLNRIDDAAVAAAGAEIRRGVRFSLDLPWDEPGPPLFGRDAPRHTIVRRGGFGGIASFADDEIDGWNTQASSQWDGFRHVERAGQGWYNGLPETEHGVDYWARHGLAGRAVLADVGRWRAGVGRPLRPDASDPIEAQDLLDCLDHQGVQTRPGDLLLVRTGWANWYRGLEPARRVAMAQAGDDMTAPGLRPCDAMAEVLWNLQVCAAAADNPALEVVPFIDGDATESDPARHTRGMGLHVRILPMLGIPIGELFWLEDLADDCAADGRYTGFFTSAPITLPHAVGSPPNIVVVK